jgi:2-polyprenyl-3-methyl-5-hydroxy-6-metoxy-1,4-benzoquinol methylase
MIEVHSERKSNRSETFSCPCCRSSDLNEFKSYPFGQNQIASKAVMVCSCGFLFTMPHPTQTELNDYYTHTFNSSRIFMADHKLYSQRSIGQYLFLSKLFLDSPEKTWETLDVGAGPGIGADTFRRLNDKIKLTAMELDEDSAKHLQAKNIRHIKESITIDGIDARLSDRFDLIILSHVLEHFSLYSLPMVVKNLASLLNPGGYLFIEVPYCPVNKDFFNIDQSPHLLFFNDSSVSQLVQSHTELKLVAQERTGTDVLLLASPFQNKENSWGRRIYNLAKQLLPKKFKSKIKTQFFGIHAANELFDPSFYLPNKNGDVLRMLFRKGNHQ